MNLGATCGAKAGRTSGPDPRSVPVKGPGLAREEMVKGLPGPRSRQPAGQGQGQKTGHAHCLVKVVKVSMSPGLPAGLG